MVTSLTVEKKLLEYLQPRLCGFEIGIVKEDPFCSSDPKKWPSSQNDNKLTRLSYPEDPALPSVPGTKYFCDHYLKWYDEKTRTMSSKGWRDLVAHIEPTNRQPDFELERPQALAQFCASIVPTKKETPPKPQPTPKSKTETPWWKDILNNYLPAGIAATLIFIATLIVLLSRYGKTIAKGVKAFVKIVKSIKYILQFLYNYFGKKLPDLVDPRPSEVLKQLIKNDANVITLGDVKSNYYADHAIQGWNERWKALKIYYITKHNTKIEHGKLPDEFIEDFVKASPPDKIDDTAVRKWIAEKTPNEEKIKKQLSTNQFRNETQDVLRYMTLKAVHEWLKLKPTERAEFVELTKIPDDGELPINFIEKLVSEIPPQQARRRAAIYAQVVDEEPELETRGFKYIEERIGELVGAWDSYPAVVKASFGPASNLALPKKFIEYARRAADKEVSSLTKIAERNAIAWFFDPQTKKHSRMKSEIYKEVKLPLAMYYLTQKNQDLLHYRHLLEEMAKELIDDWIEENAITPAQISEVPVHFVDRWYEARIQGTNPKKPTGGSGSNSGGGGAKVIEFESAGDTTDPKNDRSSSTGVSSAKRSSQLTLRTSDRVRNYSWRVMPYFSPAFRTLMNNPLRAK